MRQTMIGFGLEDALQRDRLRLLIARGFWFTVCDRLPAFGETFCRTKVKMCGGDGGRFRGSCER